MQSSLCTPVLYSTWGNGSWYSAYYFSNIYIVRQLPGKLGWASLKGIQPSYKLSKQCTDIPPPVCSQVTCNLLHLISKRKKKATHMSTSWNTSWNLNCGERTASLASVCDSKKGGIVSGSSYIKTFPLTNGNQQHSSRSLFWVSEILASDRVPKNNQRQKNPTTSCPHTLALPHALPEMLNPSHWWQPTEALHWPNTKTLTKYLPLLTSSSWCTQHLWSQESLIATEALR